MAQRNVGRGNETEVSSKRFVVMMLAMQKQGNCWNIMTEKI